MTARIQRRKGLILAILLMVALVTAIMPTEAFAKPYTHSNDPWRGSGLANRYVYGKAYNTASEPYSWMEVHSYLYIQINI